MKITQEREGFYKASYGGISGYGHTFAKALQVCLSGLNEFNVVYFADR